MFFYIYKFWPVQSGARVAAFQVGKGCRLFHVPHCLFGEETERIPPPYSGLEDRAVLLSPDGRLMTFLVPFPLLLQSVSFTLSWIYYYYYYYYYVYVL